MEDSTRQIERITHRNAVAIGGVGTHRLVGRPPPPSTPDRHAFYILYRAHQPLGPGLLESVYGAVLASELQKRGLSAPQQVIP